VQEGWGADPFQTRARHDVAFSTATAAALSAGVFAPGAPAVYLATGKQFPDALSAGAVAGAGASPVGNAALSSAVEQQLRELHRATR
jgi:hypothetical protein